jgi:uncharacterized peroxidase-related enzyme
MPYIDLPAGVPGIRSLFEFRPETAAPMLQLAEVLLRGPGTLSMGERELIAAYVSRRNGCGFCELSHSAFAAVQLADDWDLVESVKDDLDTAEVDDKLRALLTIAGQVQEGGLAVTEEAVERAREAGATDVEVHDAVLIAAVFCMFNRYVDGLGTWNPGTTPQDFRPRAVALARDGYLTPADPAGYTTGPGRLG